MATQNATGNFHNAWLSKHILSATVTSKGESPSYLEDLGQDVLWGATQHEEAGPPGTQTGVQVRQAFEEKLHAVDPHAVDEASSVMYMEGVDHPAYVSGLRNHGSRMNIGYRWWASLLASSSAGLSCSRRPWVACWGLVEVMGGAYLAKPHDVASALGSHEG